MACNFKKSTNITICAGDMNKRIDIYDRNIVPPQDGSVDYGEKFDGKRTVWAMIETVDGDQMFDGTNMITTKTHKFYIRWKSNLSIQNWVDYQGQRYQIQLIENQNERNRFYILHCNIRGDNSLPVNQA